MKRLDPQKVVNRVAQGIRAQGCLSLDSTGSCVNVATWDGKTRRCAIAHCFPIEQGLQFTNDQLMERMVQLGLDWHFVTALRQVHDGAARSSSDHYQMAGFEQRLKDLCIMFDLDYPKPEAK